MLRKGFQHGFPPERWKAAKDEARQVMIDRARRGRTLSYSDLVSQIHAIKIEAHDQRLDNFLGEIGSEENEAGRGILTAVVVHKTGEMKPGQGFFKLASEQGRDVTDIDKCWVEELGRLESYWKSVPSTSVQFELEQLPIVIPDFPGSHPFSRGLNPTYYSPADLRDTAQGVTRRTEFFEEVLVGIYWALHRSVPYAFKTKDGATRSLDAGCLKFLINRPEPQIFFETRPDGKINAVQPSPQLLSRYVSRRSLLVAGVGGIPALELSFDVNAPADERRKQESKTVVRDGAAAFRKNVLAAWGGRCAITRTRVAAAIEAAHINPYLGPKTNDIRNGLALRADLHNLFDEFLISIGQQDDDLIVHVAKSLAGTSYEKLSGKRLQTIEASARPDSRVVQYHFSHFQDAEKRRG